LNEDDVMVLDTGDDEIFIWVGKGATPEERKGSLKMADVGYAFCHTFSCANAMAENISTQFMSFLGIHPSPT